MSHSYSRILKCIRTFSLDKNEAGKIDGYGITLRPDVAVKYSRIAAKFFLQVLKFFTATIKLDTIF